MEEFGNKSENKSEGKELIPISHRDFNEFIKGRGFVRRNSYKLRDLKAFFGFKPIVTRNQVIVTIKDGEKLGSMILCQKLQCLLEYHILLYNKQRESLI